MPRRIIEVDGEPWEVAVSGRVTQYTKDEFGLVFSRGTGPEREQRGRNGTSEFHAITSKIGNHGREGRRRRRPLPPTVTP